MSHLKCVFWVYKCDNINTRKIHKRINISIVHILESIYSRLSCTNTNLFPNKQFIFVFRRYSRFRFSSTLVKLTERRQPFSFYFRMFIWEGNISIMDTIYFKQSNGWVHKLQSSSLEKIQIIKQSWFIHTHFQICSPSYNYIAVIRSIFCSSNTFWGWPLNFKCKNYGGKLRKI